MDIKINNININYSDIGEGVPVLLLHGWGSSKEVWNLITATLTEMGGFRIIALDFPGCGKSSLPDSPLSLEDYEDLTLEFCDRLEIKNPIIMGHSNGGRVTLSLAGRGKIYPKKIVLFGSAGIKSKKPLKQRIKIASFKTVKFFLNLPVVKNFSAGLMEKARNYFGSADYKSAPEVMRKTMVSLLQTDVSEILPNIKCPTLLVWGENDTATPLAEGKKIEKLIPDAGLCILEGCTHYSFLERPGQVNLILKSFLK